MVEHFHGKEGVVGSSPIPGLGVTRRPAAGSPLCWAPIWKPFEDDGYPEERWPEVREALDKLRPLSLQALVAVYRMTMSDEVERAFGKQLERMAKRKG